MVGTVGLTRCVADASSPMTWGMGTTGAGGQHPHGGYSAAAILVLWSLLGGPVPVLWAPPSTFSRRQRSVHGSSVPALAGCCFLAQIILGGGRREAPPNSGSCGRSEPWFSCPCSPVWAWLWPLCSLTAGVA